MKRNLLILGGNSKKNISWIQKMKSEYENDYNVTIMEYDNWYQYRDMDFPLELDKLSKIIDKNKDYIVIAKSIGILLTVTALERNILKSSLLVFMGYPLKFFESYNINIIEKILFLRKHYPLLFIQQDDDPQCSSVKLKELTDSHFVMNIRGNDHSYNKIKYIKKYVDQFIKINSNMNFISEVEVGTFEEAILFVDRFKSNYKYYNNWLSDVDNKLLIFKFHGKNYIIKKTTERKAQIEINNAELLKNLFQKFDYENYKYIINTPTFFKVKPSYGYITSEFYGNDLNQSYYNNNFIYKKEFEIFIDKTIEFLFKNNVRYNGFLPRNLILSNNDIYMIDFEDINTKSATAVETTIRIAWSYFFKQQKYKLSCTSIFDDFFSKKFFEIAKEKYKNPYEVALLAEKNCDDGYKMDDVVNILSSYIHFDLEIVIDIILYGVNRGTLNSKIKNILYSLAQRVRLIELLESKKKVKEYVYNSLYEIIKGNKELNLYLSVLEK